MLDFIKLISKNAKRKGVVLTDDVDDLALAVNFAHAVAVFRKIPKSDGYVKSAFRNGSDLGFFFFFGYNLGFFLGLLTYSTLVVAVLILDANFFCGFNLFFWVCLKFFDECLKM